MLYYLTTKAEECLVLFFHFFYHESAKMCRKCLQNIVCYSCNLMGSRLLTVIKGYVHLPSDKADECGARSDDYTGNVALLEKSAFSNEDARVLSQHDAKHIAQQDLQAKHVLEHPSSQHGCTNS